MARKMREGVIYVEIESSKASGETIVGTNMKRELIPEFLSDYLREVHQGASHDDRKVAKLDKYHVRVECDLFNEDRFTTKSDTGNKGLTAEIVMSVINEPRFSSELERAFEESKEIEKAEAAELREYK